MEIQEAVAVVTGAGGAIGGGIAERLAAGGASVVVVDLDEAAGKRRVEAIEADGGRAAFVRADVASDDDVRGMLAYAEEAFGGLDVVVNNAGGVWPPAFPEAEPEHWWRAVEVNLKGVMLGTHHAIAAMRRLEGGAILNVSSSAGIGFRPYGFPEYATAKAGIWRLCVSLGGFTEEGIRVNAICPDWVENEGMRRARAEMGEQAWAEMAPPVLVQPPEIAEVVVRMLADDTLAGRVMLCPCGGKWGLVPVDAGTPVEPLP